MSKISSQRDLTSTNFNDQQEQTIKSGCIFDGPKYETFTKEEGDNPVICQKLCAANPTYCLFYVWSRKLRECYHYRSAAVSCTDIIGQSTNAFAKAFCPKPGDHFLNNQQGNRDIHCVRYYSVIFESNLYE